MFTHISVGNIVKYFVYIYIVINQYFCPEYNFLDFFNTLVESGRRSTIYKTFINIIQTFW